MTRGQDVAEGAEVEGRAPAAHTAESLIVLRLEVWPDGDEIRARSLGSAVIHDAGAGVSHFEGQLLGAEGELRDRGRVGLADHCPGPWEAVFRFLADLASVGARSGFRYAWAEEAGWWHPHRRPE